jgi:hypothetical protein
MWCRMVDIEAHHACWLFLRALFMTASVLTVTSTTAMTAIISGVFIVASRPGHSLAEFSWFKNEPRVNVWRTRPLRLSESICVAVARGKAMADWKRLTSPSGDRVYLMLAVAPDIGYVLCAHD